MKKIVKVLLLIAAIAAISIGAFLLRGTSDARDPALAAPADPAFAEAVAEFKANPGFRQKVANEILPHLEGGMTQQEIKAILGEPDRVQESAEGERWHYSLFYSMFIDIQFNREGALSSLDACADATTDTRPGGSGVYHLGPG